MLKEHKTKDLQRRHKCKYDSTLKTGQQGLSQVADLANLLINL
jgi:hypothetical protein